VTGVFSIVDLRSVLEQLIILVTHPSNGWRQQERFSVPCSSWDS
jgi:hypothetical protein